jgi:hypothetical protein
MSGVNFIILPPEMSHAAFTQAAATEFPVIAEELLDEDYAGLIQLQVACLTRYANECLHKGNLPEFERLLRFIEQVLPKADSALDNALHVSFIEDLELDGEAAVTQAARQLLSTEHLQFYTEVQKWHSEGAAWFSQHGKKP